MCGKGITGKRDYILEGENNVKVAHKLGVYRIVRKNQKKVSGKNENERK